MGATNALDQSSLFFSVASKNAEGKIHSILPFSGLGDLNFSRNSVASFRNIDGQIEFAAANIARTDFTNGTANEILFEGAAEMAGSSSFFSDFANVGSTKSDVASGVITLEASSRIIEDSATSEHGQTLAAQAFVIGEQYLISFFYKGYNVIGGAARTLKVQLSNGMAGEVHLSPTTNAWLVSSNGVIDSVIDPVQFADGYYRAAIVLTATATAADVAFLLSSDVAPQAANSYPGDGLSGIDLLGYNCVKGVALSSYISKSDNNNATVQQRAKDEALLTGLKAKNLIASESGSMALAIQYALDASSPIFELSDGTDQNQIINKLNKIACTTSGIEYESASLGSGELSDPLCITWSNSEAFIYFQGEILSTLSYAAASVVDQLKIQGVEKPSWLRVIMLNAFKHDAEVAKEISDLEL